MDGDELRRTRELLNLSQHALAERLGISQPSLWQFEAGVRRVPPARARQLTRLLGEALEDQERD